MFNLKNLSIFVVVVSISALFLISCATGKLAVMPEKTALTPALFKKPIKFSGSGFKPNEVVTIELIVPKGIKIKGSKRVKIGWELQWALRMRREISRQP